MNEKREKGRDLVKQKEEAKNECECVVGLERERKRLDFLSRERIFFLEREREIQCELLLQSE